MKKIAFKLNNKLSLLILLIIVINITFYTYTYSHALHVLNITFLIALTSIIEISLACIFASVKTNFIRVTLKILYSATFITASLFKVLLGIYFREYGDNDPFSRVAQARHLTKLGEYFMKQVNFPNVSILVLSIVVIVLFFMYKNTGKEDSILKSSISVKNNQIRSLKKGKKAARKAKKNKIKGRKIKSINRKGSQKQSKNNNSDVKKLINKKPVKTMERGKNFISFPKLAIILFIISLISIFSVKGLKTQEYYTSMISSVYGMYYSEPQDNSDFSYLEKDYSLEKMPKKDFKKIDFLFNGYKHENKFTGIGEGKNLLVIQSESLHNIYINKTYNGKEITPNLNRLIKESIYFNNYFQMLGYGNSSDSEFVSLHSAYSNTKGGAYKDFKDAASFGMPKIALSKGYRSLGMHGNEGEFYDRKSVYNRIGFSDFYLGEDFVQDEIIGLGLSDRSFFKQSIPIMQKMNEGSKFFNFMVTLTCHGPYIMPDEYNYFTKVNNNKELVDCLNAQHYYDVELGKFLDDLDSKGLLSNTVIAIYGDHHSFTMNNPEIKKMIDEFIGRDYDYDDMFNIPLIIKVPDIDEGILCENIGSQLDFLPTILNIMGWNDTIVPMFGVDLLDENLSKDNVVYPQTYVVKGSFIDDDYLFERNRHSLEEGRLLNRDSRKSLNHISTQFDYSSDEILAANPLRLAEESDNSEYMINLSNYIYDNDKVFDLIDVYKSSSDYKKIDSKKTIMHAGGALDGLTYTNFLEALEENYKRGKRYFEIDFSQTLDDKYVCLHGWDGYIYRLFEMGRGEGNKNKSISYDEFMSLKQRQGYTQMDFDNFKQFVLNHPDVKIVTDIKEGELDFYEFLSKQGDIKDNLVLQIYDLKHYEVAKKFGFDNIIYTMYKGNDSIEDLLSFVENNKLFGVTIEKDRLLSGEASKLIKNKVDVYVHTINDNEEAQEFLDMGVKGIYTDYL